MNAPDTGLQQLHVRLCRLEHAFDDLLFGDAETVHEAFCAELKLYILDPPLYRAHLIDRWSWVFTAMRMELLVPAATSLLMQLKQHRLFVLLHMVRAELGHSMPLVRAPPPPVNAGARKEKRHTLSSVFSKDKPPKRKRPRSKAPHEGYPGSQWDLIPMRPPPERVKEPLPSPNET